MKKIIVPLFLFITGFSFAQESSNNSISILAEFGLNRHGTGDMMGYSYGLRVHNPLSKRFDLIVAFEANLNDGEDRPFIWEDPNGRTYDSTLHDVLAGFQLNLGMGFNIINSNKHKLGINPSVFGRYQANSVVGDSEIQYPALTGFPVPIRFLNRNEPGRTYALGYSVRLYYHYNISDRFLIGISPGFQNDTKGDTMLLTTFMLGINF